MLLLMGISLTASAQMNLPFHDQKKVHFGLGFGSNSSKFQVIHSEEFTLHDSIKVVESTRAPGFHLSIISNLHLTKRMDLRALPSLILAEKDIRFVEVYQNGDTTISKTIESIYIDLPVSLKYKSDRIFDNFRFYVLGGMRFSYDLASNSKKRKAINILKVDALDYAIEYGIGLEFYFPLFIFSPEIKISTGLPNVFVPTEGLQYSTVLDKLKSRTFFLTFQFEG